MGWKSSKLKIIFKSVLYSLYTVFLLVSETSFPCAKSQDIARFATASAMDSSDYLQYSQVS